MERTENEKIMQKKRMNKKENWVQAQKQAKQDMWGTIWRINSERNSFLSEDGE